MTGNLWYNGKNCVCGAGVVILAARQYKINHQINHQILGVKTVQKIILYAKVGVLSGRLLTEKLRSKSPYNVYIQVGPGKKDH